MIKWKDKFSFFISKSNPLRDVIVFIVIMLSANIVWKILFQGDDFHEEILFCGIWNVEFLFQWAIDSTVWLSDKMLNFLNLESMVMSDNVVCFPNGNGAKIIWGCTAIKQSFIFTVVILCSKGLFKYKIIYIPLGWVFIYVLNVFRISFILAVLKNNPESFYFLHGFLLKYLFYICIFLMWVLWEELFTKDKKAI